MAGGLDDIERRQPAAGLLDTALPAGLLGPMGLLSALARLGLTTARPGDLDQLGLRGLNELLARNEAIN
jgi:hypothetical protein